MRRLLVALSIADDSMRSSHAFPWLLPYPCINAERDTRSPDSRPNTYLRLGVRKLAFERRVDSSWTLLGPCPQ